MDESEQLRARVAELETELAQQERDCWTAVDRGNAANRDLQARLDAVIALINKSAAEHLCSPLLVVKAIAVATGAPE